jgi:hypothetical protein
MVYLAMDNKVEAQKALDKAQSLAGDGPFPYRDQILEAQKKLQSL